MQMVCAFAFLCGIMLKCVQNFRVLWVSYQQNHQRFNRFVIHLFITYKKLITYRIPIAQHQSGSAIVLEHRFYGFSNPYPDLSVKSLRVHTIQQAIDDLEYFATHVHLPMPGGDQVTPDKAPWILVGGSYSGKPN